ncbi:MAG: hypothetical protein M1608_14780, partial [Candidatus Omnitrophica bacterium]|nr:hypothetical protein [Candidatus Omnitrophota bacterium]
TGELIRTFKGHKDEVWDVMFSPNGRLLASVGKDGAVKIWDAERKPCQDTVLRGVDSLGFNSDGCLIASSINSGMLAYNPKSLQLLSAQEYSDLGARSRYEPFLGNLFSDGHTAGLFVPAERKIELWDLRTHQLLCSVGSLERSVAFAPKSRLLATVTSNQTVTVWQLPGGWRRWLLTNSTPPLAFSPDGAMLVTEAEPGRSLRAWKIGGNTVRPETILYGQGMHQCSLAWSPDGRLLAVGTWEGTVCLLAMPAGRQVGVLVGHKRAVSSLAFSPDGKTLATISSDRTLRLWHIATHRELATFDERREDLVTTVSLSFSPDGSALAAERTWADGKGTRLWYAPSLAQIADAEAEPDSPWLGSGRSPSASRNHGDGKMSPSGKKTSAGL